jgi:hypothetical protein
LSASQVATLSPDVGSLAGRGGDDRNNQATSTFKPRRQQPSNNQATRGRQQQPRHMDQRATLTRAVLNEARALRNHVEEGEEREKRVGERLDTVMVSFARYEKVHILGAILR